MVNHAVTAIVNYKGNILIGKKRSDSPKFFAGGWHIPGEGVEDGETDGEALIRGLKEEVSLEIRVGKYICSSISPTSKREVKWYECFALTDKLIFGSDLEDAKFVPKNEVLKLCDARVVALWPYEVVNYFKN